MGTSSCRIKQQRTQQQQRQESMRSWKFLAKAKEHSEVEERSEGERECLSACGDRHRLSVKHLLLFLTASAAAAAHRSRNEHCNVQHRVGGERGEGEKRLATRKKK